MPHRWLSYGCRCGAPLLEPGSVCDILRCYFPVIDVVSIEFAILPVGGTVGLETRHLRY